MDHSISTEKAWYLQFWPWFLIALPTIVVIACFYTISLAIKHGDTVVRDDYYKDGLAINESMARDQLAIDLGITGVLEIAPEGLLLQLSGTNMDSVLVSFHHPFDASLDVSAVLKKAESEGFYRAEQSVSAQRWYVEIAPAPAVGDAIVVATLAADALVADAPIAGWRIQLEQDFRNSAFVAFGEE